MMNKIDKLINLFIERISFNLYKPDKNKNSEKDDIERAVYKSMKLYSFFINIKFIKEKILNMNI
ncbi:hypothetical protein M3X99_13605 [Clostridium perfringens]|uniref:hypothetical protein n=1 Tax=Clostridium perfringens TaxID=1502 RepID=UPI0023402974|nr:hypothetical protein [Clostridium perfringens]MDC4252044.1 hypothetical protein [Clostridium perfringens]